MLMSISKAIYLGVCRANRRLEEWSSFKFPLWIVVALGPFSSAIAQTIFSRGSYEVEVPAGWTHKTETTPDGNLMEMFQGPQGKKSLPYCHITEQNVTSSIAPRVSRMNPDQVRDFLVRNSNQELFSSIYTTLVTAPKFQLLRVGPGMLGTSTVAMTADFQFSIPAGFFYRVHSRYTFTDKGQISIWCQEAAKSLSAADDGYHRSNATFQKFFASFKMKPVR